MWMLNSKTGILYPLFELNGFPTGKSNSNEYNKIIFHKSNAF